jgi:hypothetical protein
MHAGSWLVFLNVSAGAPSTGGPHARDYWLSLLAFGVGVLAGFQALHNRYPQESQALAVKPIGLTYLGLRGAVPASLYCIFLGQVMVPPWALALGLGVSTELVLRIKFFIKENQKADGTLEQILAGPFDLLKWYQDFFLSKLGVDLGDIRLKAVKRLIPKNLSFEDLCRRITDRLDILEDPAVRQKIADAVKAQQEEFAKDATTAAGEKETRYKDRLGFALMRAADKRVIGQLVKN